MQILYAPMIGLADWHCRLWCWCCIAALTFVFGVVILNSNEISFYVWACVGLVLIYAAAEP